MSLRWLLVALALLVAAPLSPLSVPAFAAEVAVQSEVPLRLQALDTVEAEEAQKGDPVRKGGDSPETALILVAAALVLLLILAA